MTKKPLLEDKKIISCFLNISTRTFDRYVSKHNFNSFRQNNKKKYDLLEILTKINSDNMGQVETLLDSFGQFKTKFVNRIDENRLKKGQKSILDKPRQNKTNQDNKAEIGYYNNENISINKLEQKHKFETTGLLDLSRLTEYKKEAEIYKQLYAETSLELKNKQERLEGATYRVGQLEAQIKNTVPLLSYRQKEDKVIQLEDDIKKQQDLQLQETINLNQKVRDLKIMKNLYIIFLFTLLFFVPLVLIYLI